MLIFNNTRNSQWVFWFTKLLHKIDATPIMQIPGYTWEIYIRNYTILSVYMKKGGLFESNSLGEEGRALYFLLIKFFSRRLTFFTKTSWKFTFRGSFPSAKGLQTVLIILIDYHVFYYAQKIKWIRIKINISRSSLIRPITLLIFSSFSDYFFGLYSRICTRFEILRSHNSIWSGFELGTFRSWVN